jgi:hypothetical protein
MALLSDYPIFCGGRESRPPFAHGCRTCKSVYARQPTRGRISRFLHPGIELLLQCIKRLTFVLLQSRGVYKYDLMVLIAEPIGMLDASNGCSAGLERSADFDGITANSSVDQLLLSFSQSMN